MNKYYLPVVVSSCLMASLTHGARISDIDRFQHEDGSLNLYVRGTYISTKLKNEAVESMLGDIPGGELQGASAVSGILDYNSPYLSKYIGFDASLYAVGKLDSEESNRSILQSDNSGFAKVGQAYLKAKFTTEDSNFYFLAGRGRFDGGTISTRDTRATPDSLEGLKIEFNKEGLFFDTVSDELKASYTYIYRSSLRNEESFKSLRTNTGEELDSVQSVSLEYDAKLLDIKYRFGISKDYLRRNETELTIRIPISDDYKDGFLVNAQIHNAKSEGNLWDTTLSQQDPLKSIDAFDSTSELINVNAGLSFGDFRAGLSTTKVNSKLTNGKLGYAFTDNAENVIGSRTMWTISGNDFNNDGETTYQIAAEYILPSFEAADFYVSGISMRAILKEGKFDAHNPLNGGALESVTERQREFRLYYRFDKTDHSGLSLGLSYTDYNIDKDFVALVSAQPEAVVNSEEMRLYMDYAF